MLACRTTASDTLYMHIYDCSTFCYFEKMFLTLVRCLKSGNPEVPDTSIGVSNHLYCLFKCFLSQQHQIYWYLLGEFPGQKLGWQFTARSALRTCVRVNPKAVQQIHFFWNLYLKIFTKLKHSLKSGSVTHQICVWSDS